VEANAELPDGASPETVDTVLVAERFLTTIFAPSDLILFRPIESWVECGQKRSRTDYKNTLYRQADSQLVKMTMLRLIEEAAKGHLNLFFGVCPRLGAKGRFDLAWQIRTVRCLWVDIDRTSVDESRERIAKAGLPDPSITVGSGNGAHLYWLLDSPYLIDDVGDPLPVETEWIPTPGGKKKPRKYIVEDGERVYLDGKHHVSRLSPRAEHVQDVLAGIAQAVGGDHTQDLTRLLRIPGPPNRKNGRNGQEPVPTSLVECMPERRYTFEIFERFKITSPESAKRKQIAAMPLPTPRKLSGAKEDKLAELIAASAIAPAGSRSEADFAVCCRAIRDGISKEEVWSRVEQVGKFADGGRRYFDLTWANAEYEVRAGLHEKLTKKAASNPLPQSAEAPSTHLDLMDGDPGDPAAYQDNSTITVDAATTPVGVTLSKVTDCLIKSGECYSRADQLAVVRNEQITAVLSPPEVAGLLNRFVEFFFTDEKGGEYKPFPPAYANTWLNNSQHRERLPAIKLFTRNPVFTSDWRLVASGFDPGSGIYYAGPPVEPRSGTEHLDALLKDFCFKEPADRTNYLGMLLTTLLVYHFIGSKPGILFNGNQPGLGKTILAQLIAIVRDGRPTETASYNSNDEEFEKRLGSIVRRGTTTVIIDNAKSQGRNPRIESACLERCMTDPILSFRLLGQSQDIRAENSHIFCITANSPDVSRDLVTRSVVINMLYEGAPEKRTFTIADPEGYALEHRIAILGELIGMVERWIAAGKPLASTHSRFNKRGWGNIVGGILQVAGEPDFLANAEEAATQLDDERRDFTELVAILANHPQGMWTAGELVELAGRHKLLQEALGDCSPRAQSTRMGLTASRFLAERFAQTSGSTATFHRGEDRKGKVYYVRIDDEMPNV
jgi:hypothetical protein